MRRRCDSLTGIACFSGLLILLFITLPLLLDEPLSALDPQFRADLRRYLKTIHQETGITMLLVTHDFAEARFLGQRGPVINRGRLEQTGALEEIFAYPATPFVSTFTAA